MNIIKLEKRIEINVMWNLVMEGKFQYYISRSELIGNKYVNKLIEQALEIYIKEFSPNGEWDIRNIFIEETDRKNFIKKVLDRTDNEIFPTKEKKIQYIKDIAYPYRISEETINHYLTMTWGQHLSKNKN